MLEYLNVIVSLVKTLDLKQNTIIGFVRRALPDDFFLEGTPKFQELLKGANVEQTFNKEFWCPTSNYIISVSFLQRFIEWFHNFLPELFIKKNHPYFHERAISVYAFRNDVDVYYADGYLTHGELYSHEIDYDDK